MIAAAVPPTTHSLPKPQRLRLMRSTRKLTALLGTTPLLVDSEEPLRTAASPLEPIDTPAYPDTIASVLSSAAECESPAALLPALGLQRAPRPTLLLRMGTSPSCQTNHRRSRSQGWGRPASLAALPPSPVSPAFADDTAVDRALAARRSKMARVARILGENVPPELVFPPGAPLRHSADSELGAPELSAGEGVKAKARLSNEGVRVVAKIALEPLQENAPLQTSGGEAAARQSASDRVWVPYSLQRSMSQTRKRRSSRSTPVVMRTEAGEWNQDESTVVKTLRELK